MGDPAELSELERLYVLKLAQEIVEVVIFDSGTSLDQVNLSAHSRGMPPETAILQMAQELIRLNDEAVKAEAARANACPFGGRHGEYEACEICDAAHRNLLR